MAEKKSKRFEVLNNRPVHKDGFIAEWIDVGLIAMGSPNDPVPSIKIENGKIGEMDGKKRQDFDMIEQFIADYAIDIDMAPQAMAKSETELAMMLVDPNVPRTEVTRVFQGLTPAKISRVMDCLNIVEIMMGLSKMRSRKTPANQAHITSAKDHPVQLAADAAEGALRGFVELETTVGVNRYAPLNALSLLIGSQTGRPGVLTQCALEEAFELQIGMRGLTSYAETVSVYGTESVFIDGDDTPWSKAFLASAYASRGLKMRFTSGTGAEVQMGAAEGKSMLYLEARCVMITKGAGVQGLQNGSISCIGVPGAVPSGLRAVAAENLITVTLDMEVASGNDQTFSHSDLRRTARTIPQLFSGTDLIFSGYSGVPNYDNMFAGSNWDIEDMDDYLAIQRDFKVDGGCKPVSEEEVVAVRNKAVRALQAVYDALGFPPITDAEVEAATYANGSKDVPDRNVTEDLRAAERLLNEGINGIDIAKILAQRGFRDIAEAIVMMMRQRVSGDYLQTSAWIDRDGTVYSSVNDPNDYRGPGTGYRISDERWEEIKNIPWAIRPEDV
ncbi:MAG TPA: propanediol/glycerol family dehydratase large subunit [Acetomicrobium flavidum]|uniref:Propanediol dehydratase, large subunit n=2 Tax=Acetomicrobium TaxID=49894 RepID=I4BU29_ACEMN|nr:propanediol/glycerol family dehydratase large subunit [Acetomicrobium mobile]NLG93884.1 propanediol/glycerol family dehydratase large subunit [Acetomicrobium flavidum]AFM20786.1 propanediol dehydratase, large subunit [Acetomicrobium mobile DSM 13181]SIN67068.1 propanediol dehydratase large subunit [Acetomicrobium flavidum]HOJ82432.1 propanediol/glycerol family dehydratase large subunit [Acetomicrobium flavidum]HOM31418.1 propanediol/glycerol family dehydratase large subunit [Acetomicrobium 